MIRFDNSLAGATIVLNTPALFIDKGLTIDGEDLGISLNDISTTNSTVIVDTSGNATTTIRGLSFTNNQNEATFPNGGTITAFSPLVIEDCLFEGNETSNIGGAIYMADVVDLTVRRTIFRNNRAGLGGGAIGYFSYNFSAECDVVIHDSHFEGNEVLSTGGDGYGGAIFDDIYGTKNFEIDRCSFINNRSIGGTANSGGAIFNIRGSVSNSYFSGSAIPPNITNGRGAAISTNRPIEIIHSTFVDHHVDGQYVITANFGTLTGNAFVGNSSPFYQHTGSVDQLSGGYNFYDDGAVDSHFTPVPTDIGGTTADADLEPESTTSNNVVYRLPGLNSVLVGAGDSADNTITTDIRNMARNANGPRTIGAVEITASSIIVQPTGQNSPADTNTEYTNNTTVDLNWHGEAGDSGTTLTVSNDSGFSSPSIYTVPPAPGATFELTPGDGEKVVYYQVLSPYPGLDSAITSTTIVLDTVDPIAAAEVDEDVYFAASVPISLAAGADGTGSPLYAIELYVTDDPESPTSFTLLGDLLTSPTIEYTPSEPGLHYVLTRAIDSAGNESAMDVDDEFVYSPSPLGPLTLPVEGGTIREFSLAPGIGVTLDFTSAPALAACEVTVERTTGNNAPIGYDADFLVNEFFSITPGGCDLNGASFDVILTFDPASATSVSGPINVVLRDDSGTVTAYPDSTVGLVEESANSFRITGVSGFSDWYIGNSSTPVTDWMELAD